MATIDHANHPASRDGLDAIGFAKSAIRFAFRALRMRSERAALHAMPDHLLKDIGIGRSEINRFTSMWFTITDSAQSDGLNPK